MTLKRDAATPTASTRTNAPRAASQTWGTRACRRAALRPIVMGADGSASNATNSTSMGMACGTPDHRPLKSRNVSENAESRPRSRPPAIVRGRLRSRPMIAAANAFTMRSVSPSMLISTSGARRMPASAASDEPIAHASDEARAGLAPCNAARVGLSTTARIARPMRERFRNCRRPTAITIPRTIVRKRCQSTTVSPTWKPRLPNR